MICARQIAVFLCALCAVHTIASAMPGPDGGESPPVPGPGLSYGGIPYGSMSGNVAEFFNQQATSSGRSANFAVPSPYGADYSPIQHWL